MKALERARVAQGPDQIRTAEEAFALRTPGLLSRVARKPRTAGPKVEFYRWLGEPHWERVSGRLEALGRDAAMLLARATSSGWSRPGSRCVHASAATTTQTRACSMKSCDAS